MSVYKRGNYYWMRFSFDGRNIQRTTHLTDRKAAVDYESVFRTRLIKEGVGILDAERIPTFTDFSKRLLADISLRKKDKPRTVRFYAFHLDVLSGFEPIGSARLDHITESVIARFVAYRSDLPIRKKSKAKMSAGNVNRSLATLRLALRTAHEWRLINRIPKIRLLKGERKRTFTLDYETEASYLAACPPLLHDAALLMLDAGLRAGETIGLRWVDIHPQPLSAARYLHVRSGKSANAARHIPLTKRVHAMLEGRCNKLSGSAHIFPGKTPNAPVLVTSLDHMHRAARKTLNLGPEFVLHSLRHTYGTRLGTCGTDAFTILRLMGHANISTSQRYIHPSQQNLDSSMQRMETTAEKARKALKPVAAD